jgi:hypothetical protein
MFLGCAKAGFWPKATFALTNGYARILTIDRMKVPMVHCVQRITT